MPIVHSVRNPAMRPGRSRAHLALLWLLTLLATFTFAPRIAGAQSTPVPGFFPIDLTSMPEPAAPPVSLSANPAAAARLAYSSYLGGSGSDYARAIALDPQGNIYIAGDTYSSAFLGRQVGNAGGSDVIVLKFSPDGRTLLAGVVIGGSGADEALDLAVTAQGEPVVTVAPGNESFPLYRAHRATQPYGNAGILLKLNAGFDALVFSTHTGFYLSNSTARQGLALDGAGNIYLTGESYDAYRGARDLIVQKYSPDGQQLLLEKVWDGDRVAEYGAGIAIGPDGKIYLTGHVNAFESEFAVTPNALQSLCGVEQAGDTEHSCGDDAFLVILDPNGTVRYASYLGGYAGDRGLDIAIDGERAISIVGTTSSADFPTTPGAVQPECQADPSMGDCYYDIFVTRLSPDGRRIHYSTFLNSNDRTSKDFPAALAVDAAGNATILGYTAGEYFPVVGPVQATLNAFPCITNWENRLCFDAFIATLSPDGAQTFGSYLGAPLDERSYDLALDAGGSIYLVGEATGPNFPVTHDAIQPNLRAGSDMFLARIGGGTLPAPGPYRAVLPLVQR